MTLCNLSDSNWVRSRMKASWNDHTTTQSQKDAKSNQSIRGLTSLTSTLLVPGRPSGPPYLHSVYSMVRKIFSRSEKRPGEEKQKTTESGLKPSALCFFVPVTRKLRRWNSGNSWCLSTPITLINCNSKTLQSFMTKPLVLRYEKWWRRRCTACKRHSGLTPENRSRKVLTLLKWLPYDFHEPFPQLSKLSKSWTQMSAIQKDLKIALVSFYQVIWP